MTTQTDPRPSAKSGVNGLHHAISSRVQAHSSRPAPEIFVGYEPTLDALARKVVTVHASAMSTPRTARGQAASSPGARHHDLSASDDVVLESGVREVMAVNDTPRGTRLALSIDASTHTLSDRSFPRRLLATIAHHGMDPAQVTVCIAQDALPLEPRRAQAIAGAIRATGCRLAVRIGHDHLSRAQLVRLLPMDLLRLDMACVATIDTDPATLRALRNLIRFAGALGVLVVAEGVERLTQYEQLLSLGCRYFQGPLVGTPSAVQRAARAVVPGMPALTVDSQRRTVA